MGVFADDKEGRKKCSPIVGGNGNAGVKGGRTGRVSTKMLIGR